MLDAVTALLAFMGGQMAGLLLAHAANRPAMALYGATGGSSAGDEATGIVMFNYELN